MSAIPSVQQKLHIEYECGMSGVGKSRMLTNIQWPWSATSNYCVAFDCVCARKGATSYVREGGCRIATAHSMRMARLAFQLHDMQDSLGWGWRCEYRGASANICSTPSQTLQHRKQRDHWCSCVSSARMIFSASRLRRLSALWRFVRDTSEILLAGAPSCNRPPLLSRHTRRWMDDIDLDDLPPPLCLARAGGDGGPLVLVAPLAGAPPAGSHDRGEDAPDNRNVGEGPEEEQVDIPGGILSTLAREAKHTSQMLARRRRSRPRRQGQSEQKKI